MPKEKPYYYSMNEILSKQRNIMFIIGGRELGKTYATKDYILSKLIENPSDKMIYIVRYQSDKLMLKDLFDDVIKQDKFKGVSYRVTTGKNSAIYINDEQRGLIVATTEVERAKRITATNYFYCMFDEFLVPKGKRYSKTEVDDVQNILQTVLRDKGERAKDTRVFFLANSTKLFNPYFENLNFKPDPRKTFNLYPDAVIQICNMDDYAERVYAADDVHNFFKRSKSYSQMAFGNKFSDNDPSLIRKLTRHDKAMYTFKTREKTLGIWYDEKFGEIVFSYKHDPNVLHRFTTEVEGQDEKTAYKAWYSSNLLETLSKARDENNIMFENASVKAAATELLEYLKIY